MHSILMMAVLSGTSSAPGQHANFGPCGSVSATQQKLEDLVAMIARITRRLENVENRFQAAGEKQREQAQAFERKREEQAQQQHKALEARIKEERMRAELQAVKEKTRFLEFSAKILAQVKKHQEREQLEKIQHHMEKLEAQLQKLEKTLHAMANGKRNSEATLTLSDLRGHKSPVYCVVFSPDGKRIASATGDSRLDKMPGDITVWDATTGKGILSFPEPAHDKSIWSLAFEENGKRLVTASWDKTVRVWDALTGNKLLTFEGHGGPV